MKIELTLEPLLKKNFKIYGDVLSTDDSPSIVINNGFAKKHHNLCAMDSNENGGKSALHLYVAKNRVFPLQINMLEKHPYFSQAFIPRSNNAFIAVVCLGNNEPDLSTLKAFITNGNQGVHYKRGIWHFPLISLKDNEQFIVIDRTDCGVQENKIEDCIEYYFEKEQISLTKHHL